MFPSDRGLGKSNSMQSPQSASPSRIPSFSPTAAGSVPNTAVSRLPDGSSTCQDIVKQLLDDLISAAALQAAGEQQQADTEAAQTPKPIALDDSSRATGARRSAITALREGIDARCDEPASIEAIEALDGTADDLLVPSPFHVVPQPHKGTMLQELTDFATESLEVEGPADSWLRASGDLSAPSSATPTASTAEQTAAAANSPGIVALKLHGPSWDDYVCDMGSKLHTTAGPAPFAPAGHSSAQAGAAAQSAAALRTAPAALGAAAGTSSSSLQGSLRSSQRTAAITSSSSKAAASRSSSKGSYAASSPRTAAAVAGSSKPSGGYAVARTPVRNSPRSPTPSGLPGVSVSPRSPGSASMIPAPLRTRIPQQQSPQPPPQQQQQAEGSPAGLDRSNSLSRSGSSRIPSALSPQPQQQQQQSASAAAQASAGADSAALGAGLDVLLSVTRRRSSSDNGSSSSSRRGSTGGAGPRDEASAAWMSSLRSGAPSSMGSRKATSRSSSAAATPPLSARTSSRQLHSTRSARIPVLGLDPVTAPSAGAVTPPVGIKSSRSMRTMPCSSVDGSANKHAQFSLRRSGSLRSSYESPTTAGARTGSSARVLSQPAGAVPLPLAFEVAAAELPEGSEVPTSAVSAAVSAAQTRTLSSSSADRGAVATHRSTSDSETWLMPCAAPTGGTGSLTSMGGGSELLSSDQEIMADPTAVRLFMELNEEIEAEGRAAMAAAAEVASAAKNAAAAPTAAGVSAAAAVPVSGPAGGSGTDCVQQGLQVTRRVSSGHGPQQLPRDSADDVQPAGEASWGSAGQDERQSVSPESQVAERSMQSDAAAAAAAGTVAVPAAVDEVRASGPEDTRNMSAGGVDPAATAAAAVTSTAPGGKASVGEGASVSTSGAVTVLAKGPAQQQQQHQQASSQSGSPMQDDVDGVEDQPSCGCKCVIM